MKLAKYIGGILLIIGTSIGGGMLALPMVNAETGFLSSSLLLMLCWFLMTIGAFYILEVNLFLPQGKHMLSMASATLGKPGLVVAWVSYIFLLYALLSAYISGGADVFTSLAYYAGLELRSWQASLVFTLLFGSIVYGGIYRVDLLNRSLMFAKLGVYLLLVVLIIPFVETKNVLSNHIAAAPPTLMVLITAFGFAIIVPNLRDYFNDDKVVLKKILFIGSLIPLICYILWDLVIMGTIPLGGEQGLETLMQNPRPTSALAQLLSLQVNNALINSFFHFFTSVCMLTAFLGVSLCLMSFFADGLQIAQRGREGLLLFILTFLPPLLLVTFYPGIYLHALNYAGIACVILLLMLPALMSFYGRKKFKAVYQVPGGKLMQGIVLIASLLLLLNELKIV